MISTNDVKLFNLNKILNVSILTSLDNIYLIGNKIKFLKRSPNEMDHKCLGAMIIRKADIQQNEDGVSFSVSNDDTTFHFSAVNDQERQKWISALEAAASGNADDDLSDDEHNELHINLDKMMQRAIKNLKSTSHQQSSMNGSDDEKAAEKSLLNIGFRVSDNKKLVEDDRNEYKRRFDD